MAGSYNRGYVKRAADGRTAFAPIAAESKFLSLILIIARITLIPYKPIMILMALEISVIVMMTMMG